MLLFGSGLLFPLYFQLGRHAGVIQTGIELLGFAGPTALALPLAGRLVDRHGGGIVSVLGTSLAVVAIVPFAVVPVDTSPVVVHVLLAALGIAIALAAVPPGIAAYKTVDPDQLADATTTTVNITQRLGGALGGALFTFVLLNAGFHAAFWTMAATSLAALATAAWLSITLRDRPA